uniref:Minor capsid protein P11 C-terminal conserved region domain-containing protein n=1 Tax=viral metagenome TaxID=1070528 RepID=A0A6C0DX26_9ZZZZ
MTVLNKVKKGIKIEHVLVVVAFLVGIAAFYKYSEGKNLLQLPMTGQNQPLNPGSYPESSSQENVSALSITNSNTTYAPYNGNPNSQIATSADSANAINQLVSTKAVSNPADLLPNSSVNEWSNLNPVSSSDLRNVNLLNPTQLVGINTQGSSLRNSNLQIRSEPPNPRSNTNCPWNISTIETDTFRRPLEIG